MERKIIHIIGTGTIGEPLIGLLCDYEDQLGIDEITFHKNSALKDDSPKVLDLINTNLSEASTKLLKADELYKTYEEQLKEAKKDAQSVIAAAEAEAKEIVALEITQANKDAAVLIQQTEKELEAQKQLALQKLEAQIDSLSQLIKEKLLGKQAVL